jgi:hypothetical protein
MNSREFVRIVKQEAVDYVVRSISNTLRSPLPLRPEPDLGDPIKHSIADFYNTGAAVEQRRSAWFQQLSEEQQTMLAGILRDCAELSAHSFCGLIDGVGGGYEGVFELVAIDSNGRKRIVNPENTDMLHDLLSEICAEEQQT